MDRKKIPKVYRIAIDERLSDDLIRLEVCELIQHDPSGEFKDEPDYWKDTAKQGREIIARPIDSKTKSTKNFYTKLMFIPAAMIKEFPWKDLKEGQVFLSGAFKIKTARRGQRATSYFVCPGKKAFEQIDDDVKQKTKSLYYEVLAKGEKDGTV